MSINKTLMAGLLEKDMDAVIRSYDLKPFYFLTLYPLKENLTLNWKSLEAIAGLKVASDIVSRGSTKRLVERSLFMYVVCIRYFN